MITSEQVTQYISRNPLTVFNTLLLIGTAYLSYTSYVFQQKTSLRESLEQLEKLELSDDIFGPILDRFDYRLIRRSHTVILLRYYTALTTTTNTFRYRDIFDRTFVESTVSPGSGPEWDKEDFVTALEEELLNEGFADDVEISDEGIYLKFNSCNAVEIRRKVGEAMKHLSDIHTTDADSWEEQLDGL